MWYVVIFITMGLFLAGYLLHERTKRTAWYDSDHHKYDLDKLNQTIIKVSKLFTLHEDNMPYGRANGFFKTFMSSDISVEYFGYEPVSSNILEEFKEYGVLLTSEGILFKKQLPEDNSSQEVFIEYNGIWKIKYNPFKLRVYYHHGSVITINVKDYVIKGSKKLTNQTLGNFFQELVDTGYTRDLLKDDAYLDDPHPSATVESMDAFQKLSPDEWFASNGRIQHRKELDELDDEVEESVKKGQFNSSLDTAVKAANSMRLSLSSKANKLVSQVRNPIGGAGFGAEVFNNVEDKLQFRKAEIVGGNNAKNGADRIINGIEVQTKYYKDARNTVNSAFGENGYRYINENGNPMQLEVPADQYVQATEVMREKILRGDVQGVSDPREASRLIRKGHATYEQAQLMTQAFNATSITHDLKSGLIQSSSPAGISVLIVFAHAKWSGATTEEAFKLAAKVGIVNVAIGTVMHATTSQITKAALNSQLNRVLGGSLNKTIVNGVPVLVTSIVLYGWDTLEFSTGRISKDQFKKNALIKTAGVGGAMAGTTLPFFGPTVGAIAVGTVTYIGAQKLLDLKYKDDREVHYPILKEEFLDLIYSVKVSVIEIEEIKQIIFIDKLNRHVKKMQKQLSLQTDTREYARNVILMPELTKIFKKREKITKEDIRLVEGYFGEILR